MTTFLEAMQTNDAYTYNGAVTNSTSLNSCLDLFFLAGACRHEDETNIRALLSKSYEQNRVTTLKIIFWAGDIRQGAGERRFFKIALSWLATNHPEDLQTYMQYVPELSRWDVLFTLPNDAGLKFVTDCLKEENNGLNLLCKWLPRRTQYNNFAKKVQKVMKWTPKQYRQFIVKNSKVVETQMCANEWNEIKYEQIPSVAFNKYNRAWPRHDAERFNKFLQDVNNGKSKVNASAIFPHDIIKSVIHYGYTGGLLTPAQITQWNSLPNYLQGENSIIPVCDVSGSMYGLPMQISVALGLYISERNIGPFKDAFFTFSSKPQLNILKGDINQRIQQLSDADWGNNTDIVQVFRTILQRAIQSNLPQEQMPKTVLIISDMEFDRACSPSGFNEPIYKNIRDGYQQYGYTCPNIVFWNVEGRVGNCPVNINSLGVALVSGANPRIIKSVLSNKLDPMEVMYSTINVERYDFVH